MLGVVHSGKNCDGAEEVFTSIFSRGKALIELGSCRRKGNGHLRGCALDCEAHHNIYLHPVNPVLEGGELSMPLNEMSWLISQLITDDEP